MSPSRDIEGATENSPLLADQDRGANGHIADDGPQDDGANDTVLADVPPTKKLVITLGAIFVGVFFAALGESKLK
jgi:hypothetical protein